MTEYHLQSIDKRLDEHGAELDTVEKCLARLTVLTESVTEQNKDHEQRLRDLESRGGDLWDKVVMTAISAVIGGVIAFALVQLGISA